MKTDKSWKKNCKRSSLSLYRRSGKFCEQNPIPSKVVHTKHVDTAHHDYGHDHVSKTTAKYTMRTTCGVQTTCGMSKMSIASVQTRTLGTRSLYGQIEKTTRKSVSTQCTKQKIKIDALQKEFLDEKLQESLCNFLSRTGKLRDFLNLTKGLVDERLDSNNMAWQAVLHLGRYAACSSTTEMRYDDECVEFLALLNTLYGLSVLNILRGPGHFGTVISGDCERGQFTPSTSKCNFPVPSHIIQRRCKGYSKKIEPGIIESALDICDDLSRTHGKQFNLSLTGC